MYTKLYEAHVNGGTVIWPLFFEFPQVTYDDYESSFMVGDAIKVSPKLTPGTEKIHSMFPGGVSFVSLNGYGQVIKKSYDTVVDLDPTETTT